MQLKNYIANLTRHACATDAPRTKGARKVPGLILAKNERRQTQTVPDRHRRTDAQTRRRTDAQMHRCTDAQTHRRTDAQTHRRTDAQTQRHTDAQTHRCTMSLQGRACISDKLTCIAQIPAWKLQHALETDRERQRWT